MRMSSNMMRYDFLRSINKSMSRENEIQKQLSDGKAIHRPSDDPVKTVRSLRYNTSLAQNVQFTQNLQDAQSWMDNTDGAMSDMSSIMIKAKELIVSADDTKPTDSLNTIGTQLDGLINQLITIGNTKIGDRYLFAGQSDATQPFVRKTIKDPNSDLTQEVVVYNGDTSHISMPIQSGAVNSFQDSVNLTGAEIFGPTTSTYGQNTLSVLNRLLETKNELLKKGAVSQTNSTGGVGTVGGAYTGGGFQSFNVRIETANAVTGNVTAASYSIDGGNTWKPTTVAATNPVGASTITLENGVTFTIADSTNNKNLTVDAAGNTHADVYSFRVPQSAFKVSQSNLSGGASTVGGTYTGTESTPYTVRITSVDASGQITGAEYSINGGTPEPVVYPVPQVDANSDGKDDITGDAMAEADNNWTAATLDTSNAAFTVVTLPNGIKLNINTDADNVANDTYAFGLPQGTGPDVEWLSAIATQYVDDDHSMQLQAQTKLGGRMSMYEMAYNMMQDQNTIITTDLGLNEDINMPQAITDFNTSQTIYRSALAVGGKIMRVSLVDFLS